MIELLDFSTTSLLRSNGAIFVIFGGFWGGQLTGMASLLVEHVNSDADFGMCQAFD